MKYGILIDARGKINFIQIIFSPINFQIENRLREIISEKCEIDDDFDMDDSYIDTLGLTSIMLLELKISLEEEFDLEIYEDDIPDLTTPRETAYYLFRRLGILL